MVSAPDSRALLRDTNGSGATKADRRILLVEHEGAQARVIQRKLRQHNCRVETVRNAAAARQRLDGFHPDLVLLDLDTGDSSGQALISHIRAYSAVPVVVISSRAAEDDVIAALDRGADDYIPKPFGLDELAARIRVALRRLTSSDRNEHAIMQVGALWLDFERRRVERDGEGVHLTRTEYRLLKVFLSYPDRFLPDRWLLNEVWGQSWQGGEHILHVYVARLRKKLEMDPAHPRYLLTESGVGYRFVSAES